MQFQKAILLLALISIAISSAKKHKKEKESKEKGSKHEKERMMARETDPSTIYNPDPCLRPNPKSSNATNAHLWFYFNRETRRCETFPYDGQVSPGSGYSRYGLEYSRIQNRFEFFQDCFKTCKEHMRLGELQVKNPKECFKPVIILLKGCSEKDPENNYFTFERHALECQERNSCYPMHPKNKNNVYSTLNDCRKDCHFTSE